VQLREQRRKSTGGGRLKMGKTRGKGGAADLCEQGKGVFQQPLFSQKFFTGAVSGCSGREEKEMWPLGFLWFRVFCGFFSNVSNINPPFV